MAFASRVGVSH